MQKCVAICTKANKEEEGWKQATMQNLKCFKNLLFKGLMREEMHSVKLSAPEDAYSVFW